MAADKAVCCSKKRFSEKRTKLKAKVKPLFERSTTSVASTSGLLVSQPRRSSRPRSPGLHRPRGPRMTHLQLLSVCQTAPSDNNSPDELHGYVALRIATMVLAMVLSLVFVAAVMTLPIHVLLVQGIPAYLFMVLAMYFLLGRIERSASGPDKSGG